jgi:hypothetical protein
VTSRNPPKSWVSEGCTHAIFASSAGRCRWRGGELAATDAQFRPPEAGRIRWGPADGRATPPS